jgi:hypothetical protein
MRKWVLFAGLVLVLLMGMSVLRAADDSTPKPGTPADNECYPGGVLYREENQDGCPTLWYWKAGWFLARFNRGLISRADFPKEFESVLPPLDQAITCWNAIGGVGSIQYIGPANTLGNVLGYLGHTNCTGAAFHAPKSAIIFASSLADASAICKSLGSVTFIGQLSTGGYPSAPSDVYGCSVS